MARFKLNQNPKLKKMDPKNDRNIIPTTTRYKSILGSILDQFSYILLYPWASLLSTAISFYIKTSKPQTLFQKITEKCLLGPFLAFIVVLSVPLGLSGLVLWIFLCTFFSQKKYSYYESRTSPAHVSSGKKRFTVTSANVLLANEFFSRLNNAHNVVKRSIIIGERLLQQSSLPLTCLVGASEPTKNETVQTDFPDVDILCLQEVWERCWAGILISKLKERYPYFIYDVGEFKLSKNRCLLGSGLFVASKYPVEFADFRMFQYRTKYAKSFSYGILCLKLTLSEGRSAYVSNLHGQAYQGKDTVLYHQLTETLDFVNSFRMKTCNSDEQIVFDCICGDFNFDNMSPGDRLTQKHPLFHQYFDVCSAEPGHDKPWAVGTELRQQRMHQPEATDPELFAEILRSDKLRRSYIIDADVHEQTIALASVEPTKNASGEVDEVAWGGMRRIDRILVRHDSPVKVTGFAFSTALAGLTDHIPVSLSLHYED